MSYLFVAIALYFAGLLVTFGLIMFGAYKDRVAFVVIGWFVGLIGELSAVIYSILWIVWLFKR